MLRRACFWLFFVALASGAVATDSWLGIYLQGAKIGFARSSERPEVRDGRTLRRLESETRIESQMLGSSFSMRMQSITWLNAAGKPERMQFVTESGGRKQTIAAEFIGDQIDLDVDNNGERAKKQLTIPKGARIVDDPTFLAREWRLGQAAQEVYIVDPVTLALVKNTVLVRKAQRERVDGVEFTVDVVEVRDPRATSRVLLNEAGDLIRIFGPMGMEMRPETAEKAQDLTATGSVSSDLGFATRVRTDRRIDQPDTVRHLVLDAQGFDLARMPSDGHQTITRTANGWRIDVHPKMPRGATSAALGAVARQQPEWVRPDSLMPSDKPAFRQRATRITAGAKTVAVAAERLRDDVYRMMRTNTSIAVLRDATEILRTREGLCRDHAILLGTLLRAAGIPARLCAGLVYDDDAFFYHAWTEYWDGSGWIGLDSTRPGPRLTATHMKLAQGRLEDAFQFFVLDGAKLKVISIERDRSKESR